MIMDDEFTQTVVTLFRDNNWNEILNINVNYKNEKVHSLLWVWPSLVNLHFIKNLVIRFNLDGITSIGCGSGLFEWLLQQSTDLPVTGIEVDQSWWTSKYAKYKFIPLKFTKMPPKEHLLPATRALMFCYFNNGAAFKEYIRYYKGNLIFIIGPGPGRGTLTNPEPFSPDFGTGEWSLIADQEVRDTRDFIAVYCRKLRESPVDR